MIKFTTMNNLIKLFSIGSVGRYILLRMREGICLSLFIWSEFVKSQNNSFSRDQSLKSLEVCWKVLAVEEWGVDLELLEDSGAVLLKNEGGRREKEVWRSHRSQVGGQATLFRRHHHGRTHFHHHDDHHHHLVIIVVVIHIVITHIIIKSHRQHAGGENLGRHNFNHFNKDVCGW